MSDNPAQIADENVKKCDGGDVVSSSESHNKAEVTDPFKEEEQAAGTASKCHDERDSLTDNELSKLNEPGPSINLLVSNNPENKAMPKGKTNGCETKGCDNFVKADVKDAEVSTEMKIEPEETKVKIEGADEQADTNLDCQQTRNLFETVGLVLRSNSNQSGSDQPVGEAIQDKNISETIRGDQDNSPNITPDPACEAKPAYCEFCGFPAASTDIFQKHMKFHDRTNSIYTCFICGIKYKKRDFIIDHYGNRHSIDEANLHKCQSCKFISSDETCLKEHVRKHFLIRPHACGICYQTFSNLYNYQRHMDKHTEAERTDVGYSKPIPKRSRNSTGSQKKVNSNANKRPRQNSKAESVAPEVSSEESIGSSSKPKAAKRNPSAESLPEVTNTEEPNIDPPEDEILPKNYFVLPTKTINLVCSWCNTVTLSKRELSQHLLSKHGDEIITFKPF